MACGVSRCRSCDQEMLWARTTKGKAMPLDPEPVPDGNVQISHDGHELTATILAKDRLEAARVAGARLYRPHHISCPQGSDWRRK